MATPFVNMAIALFMMKMGIFELTTDRISWMAPPLCNSYIASGGNWGAVTTQIVCLIIDALIYLPFLVQSNARFHAPIDLRSIFGNDAYSYINDKISQTEERLFFEQKQIQREELASQQSILQKLKGGEFILYYQPKVDTETKDLSGLEALLRLKDQDEEIHPPTFLPMLYQQGLSKSIDKKVIDLVLEQVLLWRNEGLQIPPISINFDKEFFLDETLVNEFLQRTEEFGLRFYLEITEHTYTTELERINQVIDRIRQAGHRISIDDFGAGYSSLTSLISMTADEIKLDRKLVVPPRKEMQRGQILLASSVKLCHDLGFTVVAEGIEDESQLRIAKRYGVDSVQGYLTGRPMNAQQVKHLFKSRTPTLKRPPLKS